MFCGTACILGYGEIFVESKAYGALDAIAYIIQYIGENPNRHGLTDTPARVLRSWKELYGGYKVSEDDVDGILRTFPMEGYHEPIVVDDIPFYSTCEHHMLPFYGTARVEYFPGKNGVIGLSKIPRVVNVYARRLQVQERLTRQIAVAIGRNANWAQVRLSARHLCLAARGRQARETTMQTRFHYVNTQEFNIGAYIDQKEFNA